MTPRRPGGSIDASRLVSGGALRNAAVVAALVALGLVLASATLVDRRPPAVQRISVSRTSEDGRLAMTLATVSVEFTEAVRADTVEARFRIEPAVRGTLSWDGARRMIFTPDEKLPLATEFRVVLEQGFADLQGNVSEGEPAGYAFATVGPPTLTASTPATGAADVPLERPISLTFDRLMETERTVAAIRIEPRVAFEPAWRGTTLVLTPSQRLAPGTTYQLRVGSEAVDTDGNRLIPVAVSFRTIATGLRAEILQPAAGSAGASLYGAIAIAFDRPLDPASAGATVRVTPPVAGALAVAALPSDEPGATPADEAARARALVFTPDAPLAPHTTYTVEMSGQGIRAAAGDAVAEDRVWTFTTGGQQGPVQNQILFLSDRGGIQNVWAMNPDGTNARQLTAELAPVTSFDVTPDGSSVVYAAAGAIRHVRLPGGGATTLTGAPLAEYGPRLVPGSGGVVVGRRDRATGRDEGVWLVPLDAGGEARRLLESGAPPLGSSRSAGRLPEDLGADPWTPIVATSPDGRSVLLQTAAGYVVRVDVATGTRSTTRLREAVGPPTWSSALDAFLLVATGEDGGSGSWVVPVTGPPRAGPPLGGWPTAGPEGSIASIGAGARQRLEHRSSLGAAPFVLDAGDELLDRQPALSPSGDSVVFVRVRPESPERSAGIWLVVPSVGDGSLQRLSAGGTNPRWLP